MSIAMLKRAVEVGGKEALILLFRSQACTGTSLEGCLPFFDPSADTLECNVKLMWGLADLMISHSDGSVTVIVVKDGELEPHDPVAAGIGAAAFAQAQIALVGARKMVVRSALLWSSNGSLVLEGMILKSCIAAGVIPLPWGPLAEHLRIAARAVHGSASGATYVADLDSEDEGRVH